MRAFLRRVTALSADDIARLVEFQLAAQRGGRPQLEKTARVKVSRLDAEHDRVATIDAAFLEAARDVGYVGKRQVAQSAVRWAGLAQVYREHLEPEELEALQSVWLRATSTAPVPARGPAPEPLRSRRSPRRGITEMTPFPTTRDHGPF